MKSFKEFLLGEGSIAESKFKLQADKFYLVCKDADEDIDLYDIKAYDSKEDAKVALDKTDSDDEVSIMLGKDIAEDSDGYEINEELTTVRAEYSDDIETMLLDQEIPFDRKGNTFDVPKKFKGAFKKILKDVTKAVNEDAASIFAKVVNGEHYKDTIKMIETLADEQSQGDSQDYSNLVRDAVNKIIIKFKADLHV